jgi:hypothetical protein
MARKNLAVLIIAALTASGVFAQGIGLSAGIGGYVGGDFGGGVEAGGEKIKTPYFGGGGFAFFDATYAELSVGVLGGGGTWEFGPLGGDVDMSIMNMDIALLGKFPIAIGSSLTVFPLLGADYQVTVSLKNEDGDDWKGFDGDGGPGDFSALWFKFGGGLDYAITGNLYLRFEALYGIRLANKFETDMKDEYDADVLLGHGLTAKLAVGFKF